MGLLALVMVRFFFFLLLLVHLCLCQKNNQDSESGPDVGELTKQLKAVNDYFQGVDKEYEAFKEAESRTADRWRRKRLRRMRRHRHWSVVLIKTPNLWLLHTNAKLTKII